MAGSIVQRDKLTGGLSSNGTFRAVVSSSGTLLADSPSEGILRGTTSAQETLTATMTSRQRLQATVEPHGVLKGIVSKAKTDNEKVFILKDDYGNELVGILTDTKPVLSATSNDIRIGETAVTEEGITVGEKVIPGYLAHEGVKRIRPGQKFEISLGDPNQYDYTLFQCVICKFNTGLHDSVGAEKVVILDNVYEVSSTNPVSAVVKNHEKQSIDLGLYNDTGDSFVVRYVTFKEIY